MSIAVGPLGRNGEAIGSLNSSGKVAAMYSYSKTRGLFGGVSIEGSVIIERQDANALAYQQDVTAKMLLSGAFPCPDWASSLVKTLEACTGLPGTRKWINDRGEDQQSGYAFASPKSEGSTPSFLTKKKKGIDFPPGHWGRRKDSGSYFAGEGSADVDVSPTPQDDYDRNARQSGSGFDTKFDSDLAPPLQSRHRSFNGVSASSSTKDQFDPASPFNSLPPFSSAHSNLSSGNAVHSRTMNIPLASQSSNRYPSADYTDPFSSSPPPDDNFFESDIRTTPRGPFIKPKAELTSPLALGEGVGRAIALYDFRAVEAGDLSFFKGDVIVITKKSDSSDDWWTGKAGGKEGIFPANFVELV